MKWLKLTFAKDKTSCWINFNLVEAIMIGDHNTTVISTAEGSWSVTESMEEIEAALFPVTVEVAADKPWPGVG